ncbi:HAMP domain-containing histidine kinase [Frankia sp. AgPm24]|uniref:sensor histidine kinase n=1 Tax=Frankia sp. AgPm24 TaxID=631128 RepID=UPI00200F2931|nr:HAMP domain-containing sensor histidine kinase [Frankia sp. AgPm24]MCK9923215.1 HAMP domain-containing histidine kinase [Frankia sp. AgPm24]
MTLRLRLMAGLVALCALGLAVAGTASAFALRAYLLARVDDQLVRVEQLGGATPAIMTNRLRLLERSGVDQVDGPSDYLLEIRRPNGMVRRITGAASPTPPSTLLLDAAARAGRLTSVAPRTTSDVSHPFTVTADGARYRAVDRVYAEGSRVLVALPLRPVADTVRRLVRIELAVGAAVLLVLAGLAWMLLTRGLRPLRQMIGTAAAIADGDLDRRVPADDSRSETGQLAAALNTMLAQIQAAFAARVASQEQERRFAADAAHELRTPLTSIRGYADLLRAGMVPAQDTDAALRRIQAEATRMATLVDDLLYLAYLDLAHHDPAHHDPAHLDPAHHDPGGRPDPAGLDGQRPLPMAEFDLAAVVRDAVADLRAAAPNRPVHAELPPDCLVHGDTDALRQLVGNLLTNARIHTPPDTPVTIHLHPAQPDPAHPHPVALPHPSPRPGTPALAPRDGSAEHPRGRADARDGSAEHQIGSAEHRVVLLEVVDQGPGMPADVVEHVFDRFYRAADSRAGGRGGSGLGLSIVAAIAQAHGGRIEATSSPGVGTTFRLTLPR